MYNISADYLTDTERHALKQRLIRIKPPLIVVLGRPGYAIELKQALPNTVVVYRRYFPNPEGDGDNNGHTRISPEQWLNVYVNDIPPSYGIHYYAVNEPGMSDDLMAWMLKCAQLVIQAGARACLCNFSVGTPEKADWSKADALLCYMAKYRDRLLMGIHEYGIPLLPFEHVGINATHPSQWPKKVNGSSWLLGRYRELLYYCDAHNIPRPKIAITEFGWDYIHAASGTQDTLSPNAGCKKTGAIHCNTDLWQKWIREQGLGMSWERYAYLQIQWAWDAIYRWDREIIGLAFFCYGSLGDWRWYDCKADTEFTELLEAGNWNMATSPTPTPQPTPHTGRALFWINGTFPEGVNIRASYATSSAVVGSLLQTGVLAKRLASIQMTDGVWFNYQFADKTAGWVRGDVHKATELTKSVGLNVPFRHQDAETANDHPQDCGIAALVMLMAFVGVDKTVDEVAQKAGLIGANLTHFADMIRAAKAYGFEAVARQNMQLSDILASLLKGYPVASLINYDALKPGRVIGHFVVPVGFHVNEDAFSLDVIVHDPNDKAFMAYPAAKIAQAIATTNVNGNNKFQSLVITNWDKFPTPGTQPPPQPTEIEALLDTLWVGFKRDLLALFETVSD